jgi:pSer/pThr/pTyr-binding forkhead associated (FHA) protein
MGADSSGYKLRSEADGTETPIIHGMVVGRGDDCDLVIRLGVVSRRHARINVVDGQPWVEDLGSTNGTTVNGERVSSAARLKPSDIVCFDDVAYQVLAASAVVHTPEDRDRTMLGARVLQPADGEEATLERPPQAPVAPLPELTTRPERRAAPANAEPARTPEPARPRAAAPAAPIEGLPLSWAESDHLEASSHTQALPILLRQISQKSGDTEGLIEAARAHSRNRHPRLIGLNQRIAGQVFDLVVSAGKSKWEIGREAASDIRIVDESVSGRHAQMVCEDGRWKVVNLMSVNGTFVNGRKVLSAYLKTTDKIRLGNVELAFDAGDAGATTRAAEASAKPGLWSRLRAALRSLFGRG